MKYLFFIAAVTIGFIACSENKAVSQNKKRHNKRQNSGGTVNTDTGNGAGNNNTTYNPLPGDNNDGTEFGALIAKTQLDPKLKSLKALGVVWTRDAARSDAPDGVSREYMQLVANGNKVMLNLNWGRVRQETGDKEARPFPSDLAEYKSNITKLLTNLKSQNALPEIVVIENEPTNLQYYNTDVKNYLEELKAAVEVCHKFGVKVADGALHPEGLLWFTYKDYLSRGLKDSAKYVSKFLARPAQAFLANNTEPQGDKYSEYLNRVSTLLYGYKNINLDFVNVHFYVPKSFGDNREIDLRPLVSFYSRTTGKPVLCNEWSVGDGDTTMLSHAMAAIRKSGLKYAVFFSTDGKNSTPLTDETGGLTGIGAIYRKYYKQ